jgi:mono/diheme cytochrome c family protein
MMIQQARTLILLPSLATVLVSCGKDPDSASRLNILSQNSLTIDVGDSLEQIVESDRLKPACAAYQAMLDNNDAPLPGSNPKVLREKEILCGKWMFLSWETSGKLPLPELLFQAIQRSWPDRVGPHFEKLGFLPNPSDPAHRPLGIARSTTRYTGLPSVNVTCAACHVGQLPDGRFAIGAPNTRLDLSTFNLMSYYPLYLAMLDKERKKLPPRVYDFYKELERTERRRIGGNGSMIDWSNAVFKYSKLLHILHIGPKGLPDAQFVVMPPERDLLSWINGRPGVFNPGAPMLTLQREGVPNLSIPQIWNISGHEEDFNSGRVAPLGQTTKYASLEKFVSSAIIYAYQDLSLVRPRFIRPLVSFLRQLKAPRPQTTNLQMRSAAVQVGQSLFSHQCVQCHNGASGETTRLYPAESVGTPKALENARDGYKATTPIAELIDNLSRKLGAEISPQPAGIRSRRLSGIWTRKDLMIDGSIESLEELFCVGGQVRKTDNTPHQDLCRSFNDDEKRALIIYLRTL